MKNYSGVSVLSGVLLSMVATSGMAEENTAE